MVAAKNRRAFQPIEIVALNVKKQEAVLSFWSDDLNQLIAYSIGGFEVSRR